MASLKEIKSRIQSVKSTQKITSAMKMVSSAKLRKAQKRIENFYPYERKLTHILNNFLSAESENNSVYAEQREVKRVAILVFSSNSSLCGGFNSNVAKRLNTVLERYNHLGKENILIYPVGKKIARVVKKMDYFTDNFDELADKPTYPATQDLADDLMELFINKSIDKVEMIYHHFNNKSSQVLVDETLLPITLEVSNEKNTGRQLNYIVEPDRINIMTDLIPKVLRLKVYTALLDSNASEHAARTIAMQIATDNADDLLQELNLQYNKSRQQAITNELLDIVGGSFGQS
ncbi:MAG TPA: F0F1 ATP synthase subunit gamma [Paludibacteraceae bacterium]|nr:F0F1 ATP synthase subunit gamma [Paludibacteraceae bacterium]